MWSRCRCGRERGGRLGWVGLSPYRYAWKWQAGRRASRTTRAAMFVQMCIRNFCHFASLRGVDNPTQPNFDPSFHRVKLHLPYLQIAEPAQVSAHSLLDAPSAALKPVKKALPQFSAPRGRQPNQPNFSLPNPTSGASPGARFWLPVRPAISADCSSKFADDLHHNSVELGR